MVRQEFHAPSSDTIFPTFPCIHQPGSTPNHVLLGFCGGFNTGMIYKTRTTGNWIQFLAPLLSQEVVGGGNKNSNPLITLLVSLATGISPLDYHLINITNHISIALIRRNSKIFKSSVPGTWKKTKYLFLLNLSILHLTLLTSQS